MDEDQDNLESIILIKHYIDDIIWIEGVMNEKITWDGINGWNFYYRFSGIKSIYWHLFLYNPSMHCIYYRDDLVEIECNNVELKKMGSLSRNVAVYNIFLPSLPTSLDNDKVDNTNEIKQMYYPYFCERVVPCNIKDIFRSFPCKLVTNDKINDFKMSKIKESKSNDDILIFNQEDQLSFYIPPLSSLSNVCKHRVKNFLWLILIHSHNKTILCKILNNDNNSRNLSCYICKIKSFFATCKEYVGNRIVLDSKISHHVINNG